MPVRYFDIRAGIGDQKPPEVYGAFPMDPYSHTPGHAGARQPGLTGQVKEDILCRMGELGVSVQKGKICFRPLLLKPQEFLATEAEFRYYDVSGAERRLRLRPHSLAFTCCQTPIIYQLTRQDSAVVVFADGSTVRSGRLCLDAAISRSVFGRTGEVTRIAVSLNEQNGLFAR